MQIFAFALSAKLRCMKIGFSGGIKMQGRETHFLNMRCFANLLELRIAMENLRLLSKKENQKITFSTTTEGKDDYIRIQEVDMIKKNNNKFQSFFNSLVNDY